MIDADKLKIFIKKIQFILISILLTSISAIYLILLVEEIYWIHKAVNNQNQCDMIFCFKTNTKLSIVRNPSIRGQSTSNRYYCKDHYTESYNISNYIKTSVWLITIFGPIPLFRWIFRKYRHRRK